MVYVEDVIPPLSINGIIIINFRYDRVKRYCDMIKPKRDRVKPKHNMIKPKRVVIKPKYAMVLSYS